MNKLYFILLSVGICFLACSKTPSEDENKPDYSLTSNWMSAPSSAVYPADVFYLYPSAYLGEEMTCSLEEESMRATAKFFLNSQASAFSTCANIYAPYYGQVNVLKVLPLPEEEKDALLVEYPVKDCIVAFEYFIDHYNNGRPFILAGHSQGSNVLLFLMEHIQNNRPELLDRMVASYIIGYSVTSDYLAKNTKLKFAKGADDTGVLISWNTEAIGVTLPNPVLLKNALVINPISWTRTETLASTAESLGSRMAIGEVGTNIFEDKEHYCDAKLNTSRGVVECSTIDPKSMFSPFGEGIFHGQDYEFYYYDLRANVQKRIDKYLKINIEQILTYKYNAYEREHRR